MALYTISRIQKEDKKAQVPNFVGMNILDVYYEIEKINKTLNTNINIKVIPILNEEFIKYKVISQTPTFGIPIRDNRDIVLKVSIGDKSLKVPNFIGKNFVQVQKSLHNKKIVDSHKLLNKKKLNKINNTLQNNKTDPQAINLLILDNAIFVNHNEFPKGTIIDQHPKEKTLINKYTYINFKVSLGKNNYIKLPSYIGKYIEPVTKILKNKNIFVKIITVKGDHKNFGKITKQSINPGTKLFKGESITLHVVNNDIKNALNNYKMIKFIVPMSYHDSDNSKLTKLDKKIMVKIEVKDNSNKITVFEGYKNIGEKIVEWIRVLGKAKVTVYLNNNKHLSYSLK